MCANYAPSRADLTAALTSLEVAFGVLPEVFPGQKAPLVRATPDGELEVTNSIFGLLPPWNKDPKFSRFTYNARSETADSKPSFRHAWKKRQLGLAPMDSFFEPNYETGKPIRWRINRHDQAIFFAACLWEWAPPTEQSTHQEGQISHTLLTVNADQHPLMSRFHAPNDEKRSIVTFDWESGLRWMLHAGLSEQLRDTLVALDSQQYRGESAPLPPRQMKELPQQPAQPPSQNHEQQNQLF
jgi:putative SOS response-associated peptidase YedK